MLYIFVYIISFNSCDNPVRGLSSYFIDEDAGSHRSSSLSKTTYLIKGRIKFGTRAPSSFKAFPLYCATFHWDIKIYL